jgi:benzoyl-CoA reductase/2-hydroxyglutaryl-CoA dehydratase subunit BcrC/BadD/HgdB
MALMTKIERARMRQERIEEIARQHETGRKVIGYLCVYAPVELMLAAGAIPVRLNHGNQNAETAGAKYLRSDACSFCKACLGGFELDPLYRMTDAVVAVSTCDMMRRLPESIERHFNRRVFQVYLPRASEPLPHLLAEFRRQLAWLAGELGAFTGTPVDSPGLRAAANDCNKVRQALRAIDATRGADRPLVTESGLLDLASLGWLLEPAQATRLLADATCNSQPATRNPPPAPRSRLMLGGSMLAEDDHGLVEVIEERADIVADILCTGSRSFAEDVPETDDPLDGLASFYFSRVPCMHRRPNDALYGYARSLAAARRVEGLVYKTLLYCDSWDFEARRLKQALGLPMLHLDTDYAHENREQVRTRVEAFLETL